MTDNKWFKLPKQPTVIKYKRLDQWTYYYIQGTGHRLNYANPDHWIEVVW